MTPAFCVGMGMVSWEISREIGLLSCALSCSNDSVAGQSELPFHHKGELFYMKIFFCTKSSCLRDLKVY